MPKVGLGTYGMKSVDEFYTAIVEVGYRHIDTASMYANEDILGQTLKKIFEETDIKREDLFVTTKLWGNQKKDVEGALKESLKRIQLDYVDLYLVHWPVAYETNEEGKDVPIKIPNYKTWAEMETLVKTGLTKSIGTSNFNVQSLMDLEAY
jgi:diketogulonate reductase-like aldo/keto reductase